MNSPRLLASLVFTLAFGLASASALLAQTAAPVPAAAPEATKPAQPPRTPESAVTPTIKNENRHAEFLARIQQGPIDLLFIGDSITDFWPRKGEWTWLKFARYNPANFGISADRTEHVLWRLLNGELDGISPKVVVMMIGTNNLGQCPDEKVEWAAAGVKRLLDVVQEKLPRTKILLLAVFPRATASSPLRARVNELNQHLRTFADGERIHFLDLGASFLDVSGEIPAEVMPDKLHPGPKGYDLWYAAMAPTLDALMR